MKQPSSSDIETMLKSFHLCPSVVRLNVIDALVYYYFSRGRDSKDISKCFLKANLYRTKVGTEVSLLQFKIQGIG